MGRRPPDSAYIDRPKPHNLKGKIEAMIQTVSTAQELYAKALVDHGKLAAQAKCEIDAENA